MNELKNDDGTINPVSLSFFSDNCLNFYVVKPSGEILRYKLREPCDWSTWYCCDVIVEKVKP